MNPLASDDPEYINWLKEYIDWLKEESMLTKAKNLISDAKSITERIQVGFTLGSSSSPQGEAVIDQVSTWVSIYPNAVVPSPGKEGPRHHR